MTEYQEKLTDPRWQKMRLKVFERDGFRCCCCGDSTETLHIHHLVYGKGEPWDSPMEDLETLCSFCHDFRTDWDKFTGKRCRTPTNVCFCLYRLARIWTLKTREAIQEKRVIADELRHSFKTLAEMPKPQDETSSQETAPG
jgi:hypothetical protein